MVALKWVEAWESQTGWRGRGLVRRGVDGWRPTGDQSEMAEKLSSHSGSRGLSALDRPRGGKAGVGLQ